MAEQLTISNAQKLGQYWASVTGACLILPQRLASIRISVGCRTRYRCVDACGRFTLGRSAHGSMTSVLPDDPQRWPLEGGGGGGAQSSLRFVLRSVAGGIGTSFGNVSTTSFGEHIGDPEITECGTCYFIQTDSEITRSVLNGLTL